MCTVWDHCLRPQGTLAVLVASVLAFVTFIIQLRRAASRQGIASVTGWVAGWVRGGDHSAVVLLLGAAGRSYSTGLVQGPRLAQVGGPPVILLHAWVMPAAAGSVLQLACLPHNSAGCFSAPDFRLQAGWLQ